MTKLRITLLLFVFSLPTQSLLAEDIWVDTSVSASGNGQTINSPYKTIQEAADIAQPGDIIQIRAGTYREMIVPANNGTTNAPITFQAYNNEAVTISGAERLNQWSKHNQNIYKAQMSDTLGLGNDQVFHNSQMLTWARWPNTDTSDPFADNWIDNHKINSTSRKNGYDIEITAPNLPDNASEWAGAYIHIIPGREWIHQTGLIQPESNNNTLVVKLNNLSSNKPYRPRNNNYYYVVGSLKALDTAGEWYRDENNATLYVWQPGGGSPESLEYKKREFAFDLSNKSNINITGLSIFASTIKTLESTRVTLNNITSKYPSHYDLIEAPPWLKGTHDTGIMLKGEDHTIINSTISHSSGNGLVLEGSGHKVINNTIHTVNTMGTDTAGIFTGGLNQVPVQGSEIAYNTIYNSGRSLISHRDFSSGSIHHNELYQSMQITKDGGATYTFGKPKNESRSLIAFNRIHDNFPFGDPNEAGVAVGIYLDNGSANYIITHNVVWNSADAFMHNTKDNDQNHKIINNTFIGKNSAVSSWGFKNERNVNGSEFINNIIVGIVESYLENWNKPEINFHLDDSSYINKIQFVDYDTGNFNLHETSPALHKGYTSDPNEFLNIWPNASAILNSSHLIPN